MLLIRPVTMDDVPRLLELTQLASFGLTTLPRDRALLERRVRDSQRGFDKVEDEPPRGEAYLFVMEDTNTGEAVGTSGVVSKVGGFEPFYAYRLETAVHESQMLNVRNEVQTLHLVTDHDGPCEIGSLFLHPDYRHSGNGRAISLVRFLFMADRPNLFDPMVIAEMRGVIDERGHSPFWDALGKHFFNLELPTADYLSIVDKRFIGDLMPTYPIYVPLLPPEAQAVIGKVHDETAPALRILESEGFTFSGMVDIFEAGPIVRCPRDQIRALRSSRLAIVGEILDTVNDGPEYLISNARRAFRACQAKAHWSTTHGLEIDRATAAALEIEPGDTVRHVTLRTMDASAGRTARTTHATHTLRDRTSLSP